MDAIFTVEGLRNMTFEEIVEIFLLLSEKNVELQSTLDSLDARYDQQCRDMVNMARSYSEMQSERDILKAENARLEKELKKAQSNAAIYARLVFMSGTETVPGIGQNGQRAASEAPVNPSDDHVAPQDDTAQGSDGKNGGDETNVTGDDKDSKGSSGKGDQDVVRSGNPNGSGDNPKKRGRSGPKNNLLREAMQALPQRDSYHFTLEDIKKLDAKYGPGNWQIYSWEKTSHIEIIPMLFYTQNDYSPVIKCREGGFAGFWRPECQYFFPHSIYSPSLAASLICDKCVMGLPIYRQMGAMERLIGDSMERGNVSKMLIRAAQGCFKPVYEYLRQTFLTLPYSQSDETPLQVIEGGASKVHYLWCHITGELRPDDPQIVFFEFEKTRSAEHLRKFFSDDFVRTITSDCYVCYSTIENEVATITITNCWGHLRRRFYYAFCILTDVEGISGDTLKETEEFQLLQLIGEIFDADAKVKNADADFRLEVRRTVIAPKVNEFFSRLKTIDLDASTITEKMRDAVSYALKHEDHLRSFLDDPFIPIDNNNCERSIRPVAVGRRNWLFAYSFDGADALAVDYTLVSTALKNNADPFFYVKYLCERMPGGIDGPSPAIQLTEEFLKSMMPWSPEYQAYEAEERSRLSSMVSLTSDEKPDIAAMRNTADPAA